MKDLGTPLMRLKEAAEKAKAADNWGLWADIGAAVKVIEAAQDLVREHENPVPDALYRKVLRDHLARAVRPFDSASPPASDQ